MLNGRTATHGGLPVLARRTPHSCAGRVGACPGKLRQPLALQPGAALVQLSGAQRRQAHCTLSGRQWAGATLCKCTSSSSHTVWAEHPSAAPAPRRTARLRAILSVTVVVLMLGALAAAAPGSVSASPVGSEGGQFSLGAACQGASALTLLRILPDVFCSGWFGCYRSCVLRAPPGRSPQGDHSATRRGDVRHTVCYRLLRDGPGAHTFPSGRAACPSSTRFRSCALRTQQHACTHTCSCGGRQAIPCCSRLARSPRWGPCGWTGCWPPSLCR